MDNTPIPQDDKIKATFTGYRFTMSNGRVMIRICPPGTSIVGYNIPLELSESWESMEQDWFPGDVVKDAREVYWLRSNRSNWLAFGTNEIYPDSEPSRPLTLIERRVKGAT